MRDIHTILSERALLDLVERLDGVRTLVETADPDVHLGVIVDNALRVAADFLAELREEILNGSRD
jgi:hypothetical protein